MLRQLGRLIVALMIAIPAFAARRGQLQTKPALGQVVRASSATIGGTAVPSGGTIISGDILSTATGGGALVEFSAGNQVELSENSIVTFSGTTDHVLVTVDHGNITVHAAAPGAVVVETLLCRMASTGGTGVSYSVAAPPGSTTADIKSLQGSIDVTEMGTSQTHTVGQGETWTCPAAAAAQTREAGAPGAGEQAGQAPAPTVSKHSNTGLLVLLIGGGVAGGIAAAAAGGGKGGGGGGPASPSAP
jgi:ferric-dicitrate binding protein FerR (iron transport regulator)